MPETRMKVHLLLKNFKLREEDAIVEFELILEIILVEGAGKPFRFLPTTVNDKYAKSCKLKQA